MKETVENVAQIAQAVPVEKAEPSKYFKSFWRDFFDIKLFEKPEDNFNAALEADQKRIQIPFVYISLIVIVTLIFCGVLVFLTLLVETFQNKNNYTYKATKNPKENKKQY